MVSPASLCIERGELSTLNIAGGKRLNAENAKQQAFSGLYFYAKTIVLSKLKIGCVLAALELSCLESLKWRLLLILD